MTTKHITLKAIAAEIGNTEMIKLDPHPAFLLLRGASEWLSNQALKLDTPYDETTQPSDAQLRKLAKKLFGWQRRGTRFNPWSRNRW